MFAVPGWSVSSATITTQTSESSKPIARQPLSSTHSGSEVVSPACKKRKRSSGKSKAPEVNPGNLSDLWETIIEKKNTSKDLSEERETLKKRPRIVEEPGNGNLDMLNYALTDDKRQHVGSKDKHKRPNGEKRVEKTYPTPSTDTEIKSAKPLEAPSTVKTVTNLTPLQLTMKQKLISARFRHLNQILYTTPSGHSMALFRQDPEMFREYHDGFRRQVEAWPENPLDGYLAQIKQRSMEWSVGRSKVKGTADGDERNHETEILPLPRTNGFCHIADLGCGDAGLSQGLEGVKKKLKLQVFSYDLQSPNPFVTQADIADLPLKDGTIDIAIFCLALMGTNWIDFIEEAFRILRWKGELWVTEIKSRFGLVCNNARRMDHNLGNNRIKSQEVTANHLERDSSNVDILVSTSGREDKKETDVSAFVEVLRKRGFILQNERAVDLSNKMFVRMNFLKSHTPIKGKCVSVTKGISGKQIKPRRRFLEAEFPHSDEAAVLKPCVYKAR